MANDASAGSRLLRWFDLALSGREDGAALGLFRIAVVGVMTLSFAAHLGSVGEYFSDEGPIGGEFARQAFPTRFSVFFWVADPLAVRGLFLIALAAHVAWCVGWYTSVAAVISVVGWVSVYGRNPLLYAYPDQLGVVIVFLLALMPAGRSWSLDARRRRDQGTVPVWCRRILQLQLTVVYVSTGWLKDGATWREDGTALFYTLVNPYNRHFDIADFWAAIQPWLLKPATFFVVTWEVGFGAFLLLHWLRGWTAGTRFRRFCPDLRWFFLGAGVAIHLGIQLAVYVVWFSPLIVMAYSAFLSPAEARAIVRWVQLRWRRS